MRKTRGLFGFALLTVIAFGASTLFTPESAFAGGKGKGKGPPAPEPDCPCAETIEIGPGIVCELDVCAELVPGGFECLYVCPFIW